MEKTRLSQAAMPWTSFVVAISLPFDQDIKEIYNWKPQRFISIKNL